MSSICSRPSRAVPPQRPDDARRELARLGQRDVGVLVAGRHPRVLPGRDPEAVEVALALEQARAVVLGRGLRDQPLDEVRRALVERAERRAVRVARDPAVVGIGRVRGDPGQLERLRVDPDVVAVAVGEDAPADRGRPGRGPRAAAGRRGSRRATSRRRGSTRGPGWRPRTRRRCAGTRPCRGTRGARTGCGRGRRGSGGRARPGSPAVTVRPRSSMTRVLRPDQRLDVGVGPDGDDAVAADGERLRPGLGGVAGEDAAPGEDEIGGVIRHAAEDRTGSAGSGDRFVRRARAWLGERAGLRSAA